MRGPVRLTLLVIAGALSASPATPQDITAPCRLCRPTEPAAREKDRAPVQLQVEASLNFDRLVLAGPGPGSAELGADGSRRVSGAVSAMSARAMVGEVVVRGEPGREVRVELPARIQLYGFSGGTLEVSAIRSDLPPMPRLDSSGRLSFRLGGIVYLSGSADGEFRGDARIAVDYL